MGNRRLRPDISEVDNARIATERRRAGLPDPTTRSDAELIEFARSYPARFSDGRSVSRCSTQSRRGFLLA
jgi:hypothetical protein